MDESTFTQLAEDFLEHLADTIDEVLGDKIDVDLDSGILNLKLPGGAVYVINKHTPMRQIWMSSPDSGASHFEWKDEAWIGTRPPHGNLARMVETELNARFGAQLAV